MSERWESTLHVDIHLHTCSCQSMLNLKVGLVRWIPDPKSHSSQESHACYLPCLHVGDVHLQNLAEYQIMSADLSHPIKEPRKDNE